MSRTIVGDGFKFIIIEPEGDEVCTICGELRELRPYGPGGSRICFDCGMAPERKQEADRRMYAFLNGTNPDAS